jgi:uncharacterized membrane protein YdbT with pleckstrin-like domain
MPYPQKNLNENETIALDMHPHWWYFAEPAIVLVVAIVVGLVVAFETEDGSNWRKSFGWVAILALVAAALWLIGRYMKWISTNFVITSQRLIFRQGIIAKTGIEIPLERVNNVNFSQGIIERMLGAGDLLIESGGEDGQQRFTDIRHPDQVQNLIHSQMEQVARRRGGYAGGGAAAAPAAPSSSVPEQLERLEGLLQRGTITQEEFDAQKRKLLA